jgi:hypothetical protein
VAQQTSSSLYKLKNKDKIGVYNQLFRQRNRERLQQYSKQYKADNREKVLQYAKHYNAKHKERLLQLRKYRRQVLSTEERASISCKRKAYKEANTQKLKIQRHQQLARRKEMFLEKLRNSPVEVKVLHLFRTLI